MGGGFWRKTGPNSMGCRMCGFVSSGDRYALLAAEIDGCGGDGDGFPDRGKIVPSSDDDDDSDDGSYHPDSGRGSTDSTTRVHGCGGGVESASETST